MDDKIIPADKTLRRKLIIFVLLFAIIGVFVIGYIFFSLEHIRELAKVNPRVALERMTRLFDIVLIVIALVSLFYGIYSLIIAVRVIKSGRFPPPGTRVIRDTHISTGKIATIRAISLIAIALVMILVGILGPLYVHNSMKMVLPDEKNVSTDFRTKGEKQRSAQLVLE